MPGKPVLVATNPLHYVYFRRQYQVEAVGSIKGLIADYAIDLGFDSLLTLYDCDNTIEALIAADASRRRDDAGYVTWRPTRAPVNVLGNGYALADQFERKTSVRKALPNYLFPAFTVVNNAGISKIDYAELKARLGNQESGLVAQIDFSTGGKGTFFVTDSEQFAAIKSTLQESGQDIVISRRVQGDSYGVQCFIGNQETYFMPWWHKDLVAIPGVCNLEAAGATKYCGAILDNIPATYRSQVKMLVELAGTILRSSGYRGIFGMDIVVDGHNKQVYLIELNPRTTAVSHVYATAMRALGLRTDFLTTQTEELLNYQSTGEFCGKVVLPTSYYYLKMQNLSQNNVQVRNTCKLGVYDQNNAYKRFGFGIESLFEKQEIVIIPEARPGAVRKPGERAFSVVGSGDPVDNGLLTKTTTDRMNSLHSEFLCDINDSF